MMSSVGLGRSGIYRPTSIIQQQSVKSGWLRKQGGVMKSWHRRWFTIRGDMLYYYNKEDEVKPAGTLLLPGNRVEVHPYNANEPDRYQFEILTADKSKNGAGHDSLMLAAASEDERNDWVKAMNKVMFADKGGAIFGQSLKETMEYEVKHGKRKVPRIVEICIEFIRVHGMEIEGLFRLAGRQLLIREYRKAFDHGETPPFNLDSIDVHTVASLVKLYLRELPEPVIPFRYYETFIRIVTRDLHIDREKGYQDLVKCLEDLPEYNYNLLKYLCKFLNEVGSHEDKNKMNHTNLATIFVQSFIRPEVDDPSLLMGTADGRTSVTHTLILHVDFLFKLDYNYGGCAVQTDQLLDLSSQNRPATVLEQSSLVRPRGQVIDDRVMSRDVFSVVDDISEALPSPLVPGAETTSQDADSAVSPSREAGRGQEVVSSSRDSINSNELARKRLSSSEAASEVASTTSSEENEKSQEMFLEDNQALDVLLQEDVSSFTAGQLLSHREGLCQQISALRDKYRGAVKQLQCVMSQMQGKHQAQMTEMARKLEKEKVATAKAVDRVMQLQLQNNV